MLRNKLCNKAFRKHPHKCNALRFQSDNVIPEDVLQISTFQRCPIIREISSSSSCSFLSCQQITSHLMPFLCSGIYCLRSQPAGNADADTAYMGKARDVSCVMLFAVAEVPNARVAVSFVSIRFPNLVKWLSNQEEESFLNIYFSMSSSTNEQDRWTDRGLL